MKIARFSHAGHPPRLGVVEGDSVVDVLDACPGLPADLRAWLPGGTRSWAFLASLLPDAPRIPLAEVVLHPPVTPGKLMGLGANYQAHLDEVAHLGLRPMPHQIWFNKQVSSLNDPFADILIPAASDQVDYEGELAVVIGRRARRVSAADALSVVAGYTVCNDVSVRDVQMRTPTHTLGKSFDTHGPLGPWMVTADEIPNPQDLMIRTWVNDELRQEASTATMIHSVAAQIAELSATLTLEPGDVLATGTPAGCAIGMQPPRYLVDGDVVRIEVERIGTIRGRMVRSSG